MRNWKKRVLSLALAVVMIVCMVPISTITASAATAPQNCSSHSYDRYDSVGGGTMKNNKLHAIFIANGGAYLYMYGGTITGTQGVQDNDGYGGGVFVRPGYFYIWRQHNRQYSLL